MLAPHQVIWQPYTQDVLNQLPQYCLAGQGIWKSVVPLFNFCFVEWHHPDRVVRQFGFYPVIPPDPYHEDKLHLIDLRSGGEDWPVLHGPLLEFWNQRHYRAFTISRPIQDPSKYHSDYMDWYRNVTRRWITFDGAMIAAMVIYNINMNFLVHLNMLSNTSPFF